MIKPSSIGTVINELTKVISITSVRSKLFLSIEICYMCASTFFLIQMCNKLIKKLKQNNLLCNIIYFFIIYFNIFISLLFTVCKFNFRSIIIIILTKLFFCSLILISCYNLVIYFLKM